MGSMGSLLNPWRRLFAVSSSGCRLFFAVPHLVEGVGTDFVAASERNECAKRKDRENDKAEVLHNYLAVILEESEGLIK